LEGNIISRRRSALFTLFILFIICFVVSAQAFEHGAVPAAPPFTGTGGGVAGVFWDLLSHGTMLLAEGVAGFTLVVSSAPPGASIFLDGGDTGEVTPAEFADVPLSTHNVTVVAAGYLPGIDAAVGGAAGATTTVHFDLTAEGDEDGEPTVTPEPTLTPDPTETPEPTLTPDPTLTALEPAFSANATTGAVPLAVAFTDESAGSVTGWFWDFGDGNTSVEQHPVHTYTGTGRYTVSLTVADANGTATVVCDEYIDAVEEPAFEILGAPIPALFGSPLFAPAADFTGTPTSGLVPLTVSFTDTSTGGPTGWAWFFGDETYDQAWTLANASAAARAYHSSVALPDGSIVLMGGEGDSGFLNDTRRSTDGGTTWTEVNASSGWSARWYHSSVALPDGSLVLMGGMGGDGIKNDTWRSDDGGKTWTEVNASAGWSARWYHSSVALPDGSLVLMGGRDSSLTSLNDTWRSTDNGATWTEVNASSGWSARWYHSSVALPDGSIVLMGGRDSSFTSSNDTWRSTDNGTTWTEVNASAGWSARGGHSSVALPDGSIVLMGGRDSSFTSSNDTWRSIDGGETWTQLPNADGWSAREAHSSAALPDGSIVLMGGVDSDENLLNDVWRLQPAGSTDRNPTHEYTTPGTYSVTLQAYSDDGYNSTLKVDYITVTEPVPPAANFTGTPVSGVAPLTVSFTDASTGSPTAWNWSFGGGAWFNTTDAAERNATHTYTVAGTYSVGLTVANAAGEDTLTRDDYITVTPPPPTAAFIGDPTSGLAPLTVNFTDHSTGDPTGWAWLFGDETYDQAWTLANASAGWTSRMWHSSAALPDGSFVLMGGTDSDGNLLNDTWRSTDNGTAWTNQTAASGVAPGWPARLGHTSVALPDGNIVLMGGVDNSSRLNDTWRSTDNGATWALVNASAGWSARYDHSSVVLPDGSIVLMGGMGDNRLNDTWRSADGGATWTLMNNSSEWPARYQHSSVVLPDGSIVLMGGYGGGTTYFNDTWRSTDNGKTWTQLPNAGWSARYDHSSVALPDGGIVLMGGMSFIDSTSTSLNDTWRSTDGGKTWMQLPNAGWATRGGHTSVALPGGSIVLMGGADNSEEYLLNDVWRLQSTGSTDRNPTHIYDAPGTYSVTLQAYNNNGYNSTRKVDYITVTEPLEANFTGTPVSGLAPLNVSFTDASTGSPTGWNWSFGDGAWFNTTNAAEKNPTHTYTAVGNYSVGLTVANAAGEDTLTRDKYITVTVPLEIDFTGTPTSGSAPLTVTFTDHSTGDPTGWAWFFGDETYDQAWAEMNASAGWTPRYAHASVALPDGSIVLMGGVEEGLLNDVWRSADGGTTWTEVIAEGVKWSPRFFHSSVALPDGNIVLMGGMGGDGFKNDVWRSTNGGATWKEVNASAGWAPRMCHSSAALPDGSIVLMGGSDGPTRFNDTWRSTDGGATWTQLPNAGWTARQSHSSVVLPDGSLVLMGGADSDSAPLNDTWRLTDNGTTWTRLPDAGWPARGSHGSAALPDGSIVLMGGVDNDSAPLNDTWRSTDNGTTWTRLPDAGWAARGGPTCVALPDGSIVLVGGMSVIESMPTPLNDVWRLQPAGSTDRNPSHIYDAPSTYSVALQAYNGGGYDSARKVDYITVMEPPEANFTGTPVSGLAPLTVSFTDASTGSPAAWNWSFGDGAWFNTTNATEKNPTHTYTAVGNYSVGLTVANAVGEDTLTRDNYITVVVPPAADFSGTPTSGPAPLTVTFTDHSTGDPTGWAWFFGDETYGDAWTPVNNSSGWSARQGHTSIAMPNGSIVLMGGMDDHAIYKNDVWLSVDNGTTWTEIVAEGVKWSPREHTSVVLHNGSILLMGGVGGGFKNDVWRSDNYGISWTEVDEHAEWLARVGHTSVVLHNGSILLMGGQGGDGFKNDVWRSDDGGETWTEVNASAGWSARRYHTSVVLHNGSILLIGGFGVGVSLNDVWRSDDGGATWTQLPDAEWPARDGHTSVVMPDGSIVIMGGQDNSGGPLNDVWRSTDGGATWTQLPDAGWLERFGYTSVVTRDASIVLMGGMDAYAPLNDVWRLQTAGSMDQNPTHEYTAPGTYSVALQAYNAGGYNSTPKVDYVTVAVPPEANFTGTPTSGLAPLTVSFTDASTGSPTAWNWSFGDGAWFNTTDAAERNATHTYTIAGTYSVVLTVVNAADEDTLTRDDYITVTDPPAADFTGAPTSGLAPLTVSFTDTSTGDPTGWAWFFGDETYDQAWAEMNASAGWTPRMWHTSVALPDGSIVLTGGSDGGPLNDVYRSTDNGATWTLANVSAGWAPRMWHTSVALPDGSIVLMGGMGSSAYLNDVWRSTDNGATWTEVNASAGWPARGGHSSVVLPDGSIVLMGGAGDDDFKNDVWRSTDNGTTWTEVNASAGWTPRVWHSSVALPDGGLVLMGGVGASGPLNDTWRSADGGETWTQLPNAGWSARSGHTSAALPDGSLVLMGGVGDVGRLNDVWRSTDNGTTWTEMNASAGWSGRSWHTCVAMRDGSLVLMGGMDSDENVLDDVWRLQPAGSTDRNPTHEYTAPGTYSVTLQAYNGGGYDRTREINYITVAVPPEANFTGTPTSGLAPLNVSFTDASTGSPTAWNWSFGDGVWFNTTNAAEKNPTHEYTAPGTYPVGLTVANAAGEDTLTRDNYITAAVPPPTAAFIGAPTSGPAPLNVSFTDHSTGEPTGWAWFFGDETYTGAWDKQTENAGWSGRLGPSSVALPDGSLVLMGGFALDDPDDIHNKSNTYKNDTWRSADGGATWTEVNANAGWPARQYHSSVVLPDGSLMLLGGLGDLTYFNDTWRSTDGGKTWTEVNASAGWTARYMHTSVALPDGSIVLMGGQDNVIGLLNDTWRLTDGGTTWTEVNASAEWSRRYGHSSVVLPDGSIVLMGGRGDTYLNDVWRSTDGGETWTKQTDEAGWTARYRHTSVAMPDGSIVLMGGLDNDIGLLNDMWRSTDNGTTWTPVNNSSGLPIRALHTSVVMHNGSIVLMGSMSGSGDILIPLSDVWRLQPAGSTEQDPTHEYTAPGTYAITLQAYNPYGFNASTVSDYISVSLPPPVANFTFEPGEGNAPLEVQFNDTSAGNVTAWSWDFGDENTSTDRNPVHTYAAAGTYTVSLNASNAYGYNISTVFGAVQVLPPPVANFSVNVTVGPAPLTVSFTDTSTGNLTGWAWFFGDETYDQAWTQVNASAGWAARFDHTSVVLPDGSIVLMGGYVSGLQNDTWRSADGGKTWTEVNANAGWPARQYHSSVALPDGSIVLMGGLDSDYNFLNDVWRSTDGGTTWTLANTNAEWPGRSGHTSVALPDGSIVLMGGEGGCNDVWRSTDGGKTWTQQTASAGWSARQYHSSVALPDGSIVLMGGEGGGYRNDVWRSADGGKTWTEVNASAGWAARQYHSSVALPDGSIVLMGGMSFIDGFPTPSNDTWRSTDNGTTWMEVNASAGWAARFYHTSVVLPDGSIVLMSGVDSNWNPLNDVWRLQPAGSTEQDPTHEYTAPGTYSVTLQAYNPYGSNTSTASDYISVFLPPSPVANLTFAPHEGNAPLTVQFNDTSAGSVTAWFWTFGDGNTSTLQHPEHTYAVAGTYTVTLNASNAYEYNVSTVADAVLVLPAPVANFTLAPGEGNAPLTVQFNDTSFGNVTAWSWDFGDGNTSTLQHPEHIYAVAGTYPVSLNASNAYGFNVSEIVDAVQVLSSPVANFTFAPGAGNAPLTVQFNDTSVGNVTAWSWDFGDGNTSTDRNPAHTYAFSGVYPVSLNASNAYGYNVSTVTDAVQVLPALVADFTFAPNEGNAPLTVQFNDTSLGNVTAWRWDFGDGNTSTDRNATHTYASSDTYTVSLNASNAYGYNVSTVTDAVQVLSAPVADFTFAPSEGNAPLTVQFNDTSAGNVTAWSWDFGDGNTSTLQHPEHTYAAADTYTVSLNASNVYGYNVSTVTDAVQVLSAPVANFTSAPSEGNTPLAVQFNDTSLGNVTAWSWDFGDGNTSTAQNPVHTYAAAGTYPVSLNASNAYGYNVSTVIDAVQVLPAPVAGFTFAPSEGNAPLTVQFNDTSIGNVTAWSWDFGDGNTSTDRNPVHTYVVAGTYSVSLNASNMYGYNVSTMTDAVQVLSSPVAGFTYTPNEGNAPLTVQFNDTSAGNVTAWNWDFGDGNTSTTRNATHAYASAGVYTVSLNVSNAYGWNISAVADAVQVLPAPVANFTYAPSEGNAPLAVQFNDTSLGNVTAWNWDFGDGNTSTDRNPVHIYAAAGTYPVSLNASNAYGYNISTAADAVLALSSPVAGFTYAPSEGNAPLTVQFNDTSAGNVTAWSWDFGDGNTSTDRNATHAYASAGVYTVSLNASNAYGFNISTVTDAVQVLSAPVASFTFAPNEGNAPLTVQLNDTSAGNVTAWSWDFGDGNTSTDRNATHTYAAADTYTVSLNASNAYGYNVSTVTDAVQVLSSPVANFTFAPDEGNAPLTVQFNDTSAGNMTGWVWDFGDGSNSTAQNPVHTYSSAGTYSVSLNASNAYGWNTLTVTDAVRVLSSPVAGFTYAPDEGNAPLTVQFNDTSLGNVTAWNWDFGDGNSSTARNATHTYAVAGTYSVSLNASNAYGYNVSTVTDAVQVLSAPVAGFMFAPNKGNAPLAVQFNDTSAGNITAWSWDFGDGNTSTDRNATHTYAAAGTYTVSLNASNAYGYNVSTVTDAVQVLSAPVANFTFAPNEGNAPLAVQFNDTSAGNVTGWSWDFGDGNTSTDRNATHIYAVAGTFSVSLNASNAYGYNESTVTEAVQVFSAPAASFTYTPNEGKAPLTVQFNDTSAGNVTAWNWDFGDGNTSTARNVTHTYAAAGTYSVSLNASNVYGWNISTVTDAVRVLSTPVANFTYAPNEGNTPLVVQFNDTSLGNVTTWSWDFGDGNTSTDRNPVHIYASAGVYTVNLNASNAYGWNVLTIMDAVRVLPAPVADFTFAPNEGNTPLTVQFNDTSLGNVTTWNWDFGDGNASTDRNITYTYAAAGTYSVNLNVSNAYGYNMFTVTDAVRVLSAPVAGFTYAPSEGNAPLTVQFNDTSIGNITAWSWDFGDGSNSTAQNPVHTYAVVGTYSVSLNASNAYGYNVSTATDAVQVLSAPVADFTYTPKEGNAPLEVQFNGTSVGNVSAWFWDFGDGNTSTDRNATHTYVAADTYTVSLNASNAYGYNVSTVTDAVQVLSAPVADFTFAPSGGNAPLMVQFNDTSAGNVTAWNWDFGDGNTSTLQHPEHTYAAADTYTVSLNVSNAYGFNESMVTDAVQVLSAPVANFIYAPNEGNAPLAVQFNDTSLGNVTAWNWDFGDGNTSTDRNATHTYAVAGMYSVSLNASNVYGYNASTVTGAVQVLPAPVASFTFAPNEGNAPLTVQFNDTSLGNVTAWSWDFGDGNTSTDRNATHTYVAADTYTVSLNASNAYGYNVSTVADAVLALSSPVANFTYAPSEGNAPLTVQFNDTSAGNATAWSWDFGDGNTSTDRNATHAYASAGVYMVSLNASNTYGFNISTVMDAVQVLSSPVANFTFAPNEGNTPLTVQFNDTSAGNVTGWVWDFGDGNTSTDRNATHTYASSGTYPVSLNASNAYGYNVSTVTDAVQVLSSPIAGFTYTPSEGNAPLAVQFNDTSAGNVTAWNWDFGDGNTSTDRNATHTYASAGVYPVSLNASNTYEYNVSTVTDAILVLSAPVADFTYAPNEGNAPLTVQFTDTSAGNVTAWSWSFGDGNASTLQHPEHTYVAAGTYTVSLNASNAYGYNVSTVADAVQVLSAPVADFILAPNEGNAPLEVQFNDTSGGNVTAWNWDFGDGNTSTARNPVHTYAAVGTYSVSLNASNMYGYNVSTMTGAVQVLPAPVANFTFAPNEGNAPLTVQFNDTSAGNVTAWSWDFGDGNTSTDRNPIHTYTVAGVFPVSLNASNAYGYNVSTVIDAVQVLPAPVASFTYAPNEGNAPLAVQFTDTSAGNVTAWSWDFGDGNTSTAQNATHIYAAAGTYTVSLNASNAYGWNTSTVTGAVQVLSTPVADFAYAPNAGNTPLTVQFNDTSAGNVTGWVWDFGDGNTSTDRNPIHAYVSSGTYTVSLNASNAYGYNVSTVIDAVQVLPAPVAGFTFAPSEGNAPLAIQFNDTSAGNVTEWSWNFGDGNTSTDRNPVHTYAVAGVYTVSLNASNIYGYNVSTVTDTVQVLSAPVANFTYAPGEGNAPLTVQFNDTSAGDVTAWVWNFGDGQTSTEQNATHIYPDAGTYTVSLNASNAYGSNVFTVTDAVVLLAPPIAGFTFSPEEGNAPLTVTFIDASSGNVTAWSWDFGDGNTSTAQNATHIYAAAGTYTVSLNASNAYGYNESTVTDAVQVFSAPVANFTVAPNAGNAPLEVQFTDTSAGNVTVWSWDFGDGNTSTDRNATHTYAVAGMYSVSLNASNAYGYNVSTVTDAVQVFSGPVASFTYAPNEGNAPLTVQFNDTSAGNVTAWNWDFGDGNTSTVQNPVHTYAVEGTYPVSLNASNIYGYNVSTVTEAVLVFSAPVANFTYTPGEGNAPLTVQFTDASIGNITTWSWNFGDGNTSTDRNATHTYAAAGMYSVSLNASNAYGYNVSTVTEAVRVLSGPVADFTFAPNAGNAPLAVQFNDTSAGNVTAWYWSFGNGNTSAEQSPVHTYAESGAYTVSLNASNAYGSSVSTVTDAVVIFAPPVARFTFSPEVGNAPLTVQFNDTSAGNVTAWSWDFGDGNTSTAQNPVHTYVAAGVYTVSLNASNAYGFNVSTVTEAVRVLSAPVASFTHTPNAGNAPLTVQFNDTSTGNVTAWSWDFGDGATSAEQNPVHTYTAAGTYTVTLTVENDYGSDSETKTDFIVVREPAPAIDFTADNTSGTAPLTVTFTAASTGGKVDTWLWDFGDNATSAEQNPVHTYTAAGVYTVNLTATNGAGSDTEVKTGYITVTEPEPGNIEVASTPAGAGIWLDEEDTGQRTNATLANVSVGRHVVTLKLDGYADASKEVTVVSGETATVDLTLTTLTGSLEVTSTPAGAAIFIDGAGTGTTTNVTLDGIAVGTHTVTVTKEGYADASAEVIIVDGETATVHFNLVQNTGNIAVTSIPEGAAISLDGTDTGIVTSDTLSGVPVGNHTVAVTLDGYHPASSQVTVSSGLTASVHFDLVPSTLPPVANFSVNVTSGAAPLTVQFTDTSTGATAWAWDFGDGNTSAEQHPVHVYDAIGVYTVTLTATNDFGSDSEVRTNYITVTKPDAPVADFTGTPVTGDAPLEVRFADNSAGKPVQWLWEFGNGRVATTKNPITTYRQPGTYTVNLTVSNDFGSDSKVKTNYITVTQPDPVASFTADHTSGNADLTVQFTDTSTGSPTSWSWDFGDGAISIERNPAHTYTTAGTYTVTLEVRRDGGPASTEAGQITVKPVAGFTAGTTRGDAPFAVQFTDTSTGSPTSWSWDFGDGNTSAEQHPAHTYTTAGTYTVTLTVTGGGQAHTEAKAAYITAVDPGAPPAAEFRADTTEGYAPLIVRFFDQSRGDVDEWLWNFGDGSISSDQNPEHTYTAAGTYTVTLTVQKAGVQTNTRTKTAYVTVDDPKPVADFTATRLRGEAPLTVQFTDTSTGAPPLTRAWDFGDGTSSALNPTHIFDHDGEGARTYTVTLTVTNSGGSDVKTTAITVVAPPQKEDAGDRIDQANATAIEDIPLTYQDLTLEIPKGHEARQADGSPITEFSVGVAPDLEEPPAGTIEIGGKAFKLGPEGAKFNPKIPVTITFTRDEWENLFGDGRTTKLQRYDGRNWIELENQTRDDATFTITGYTDSFSVFAPVTTTISPEPTTTPGSSGGGGRSTSPTTSAGTADLLTSSSGAVLRPYLAHVDGNFAHLFLKTGVTALDGAGSPLSAIGIAPVSTLPGASSLTFSGYAVDCTPAGATFSPAIDLVFTLTGNEWAALLGKAGGDPARLVVQGYDTATGAWTACPTSANAVARTVTALVSHFSTYALFIEESAEPPVTPGPTETAKIPAAAATTAPPPPAETGEIPFVWIALAVLVVAALAAGYVVWKRR